MIGRRLFVRTVGSGVVAVGIALSVVGVMAFAWVLGMLALVDEGGDDLTGVGLALTAAALALVVVGLSAVVVGFAAAGASPARRTVLVGAWIAAGALTLAGGALVSAVGPAAIGVVLGGSAATLLAVQVPVLVGDGDGDGDAAGVLRGSAVDVGMALVAAGSATAAFALATNESEPVGVIAVLTVGLTVAGSASVVAGLRRRHGPRA
jgi:hypothetical protein